MRLARPQRQSGSLKTEKCLQWPEIHTSIFVRPARSPEIHTSIFVRPARSPVTLPTERSRLPRIRCVRSLRWESRSCSLSVGCDLSLWWRNKTPSGRKHAVLHPVSHTRVHSAVCVDSSPWNVEQSAMWITNNVMETQFISYSWSSWLQRVLCHVPCNCTQETDVIWLFRKIVKSNYYVVKRTWMRG